MLVKSYSGVLKGIRAVRITIEVNVTQGIRFFIVGLADHAIRESQQRIESALAQNGFIWPRYRVVINLAPANIRKEGTHFDLPIALGILAATSQVSAERLQNFLVLGELSLDGSVIPVKGVLPMVLMARENGFKGVIVPTQNCAEASIIEGLEVLPVADLDDAVGFLNGDSATKTSQPVRSEPVKRGDFSELSDFSEVSGQESAKRAMVISVAGRHNLLMVGPPGSGKTMLAQRLPSIMPEMTMKEALETTIIHSVAGKISLNGGLISTRPFRSPHHTSSHISIIGGGQTPLPGEITMAHNGVLFLDELPEFRRSVLEVLRQPMEERMVHISRAYYRVSFPSDFLLIAAMNPCPCGYHNHPKKLCSCGPGMIRHYLSRISGPLLDRIDIHLEVSPSPFHEISSDIMPESSDSMRNQVMAARKIQLQRFSGLEHIQVNAQMSTVLRRKHCILDREAQKRIQNFMEKLGLSARAYDRILKVARTIADLEESRNIRVSHVTEAISYRSLDREGWSG